MMGLRLLFLAAAVSGCSNQTPKNYSASHSEESAQESLQLLSSDSHSLVVAVQIPQAEFQAVTLDGSQFQKLSLAGFDTSRDPGTPELPEKTFFVRVPDDTEVTLEAISGEKEFAAKVSADLAFTTRLPVHSDRPVFVPKKESAYHLTYGNDAAEIVDVSYAGAVKLATIRVRPVYYDALNREVLVRDSFEIHFSFRKSAAESGKAPVTAGYDFASAAAINGEPTQMREADARIDLIIAHESHRNTLTRYLDFKRGQGRTIREHYINGLTASQVKDIIKREYAAAVAPSHTLIVGNISQIPSWRGTSDNSWTDFSYTTLDAGEVPDLSLGRIPAHNAQELNAFIDKAMNRENETRNNEDVLTTAGKDVSLGCPANVTKVGDKIKAGSGTINIIKRFRSNGASTDDVINAYNGSPNIVVYDGHGDRQGMQEIPLVINNLSRLTNGKHPIIFDIACLNANWSGGANARNFAETILLQQGTGAAGILASGGSGYGHDFFQTMGSLMAQARQELAVGKSSLNDVGLVVLGAKVRHGSQDRTFWNYYGDPATTVWSAGN